jgi:6-pyruvoyltetrahydropterin/6-carboxytetrahydropterin synthase
MDYPRQAITVRHNVEAAHRLYLLPGKCEAIHGHSFDVSMGLHGEVDKNGMVCGLDFGVVKRHFRDYLDAQYDHRLLLNQADPFASKVAIIDDAGGNDWQYLPGVRACNGDPTTENMAQWIGEWAVEVFTSWGVPYVSIDVHETAVNAASWHSA